MARVCLLSPSVSFSHENTPVRRNHGACSRTYSEPIKCEMCNRRSIHTGTNPVRDLIEFAREKTIGAMMTMPAWST